MFARPDEEGGRFEPRKTRAGGLVLSASYSSHEVPREPNEGPMHKNFDGGDRVS
jgi:hypothetical protein